MPTNKPPYRWLRLLLVLITLGSAFAGQYFLSIRYVQIRAALGWGVAMASFLIL
jgi:hypothetical protein